MHIKKSHGDGDGARIAPKPIIVGHMIMTCRGESSS